jgi:hypothetical protein
MASSRPRTLAMLAGVGTAILAVILVVRQRSPSEGAGGADAAVSSPAASVAPGTLAPGEESPWGLVTAVGDSTADGSRGAVMATLGWGRGEGRIGEPDEHEGEGETPLRLATDAEGNVLLLDGENGRVVRLGPDGAPLSDVPSPVKHPRDVAVAKDGTLLLLDADGEGRGEVVLVGPDGRPRGKLPIPEELAKTARSVEVSGKDVYVESYRGELTRVGDPAGAVDPDPKTAPGLPTRDGRGFLNARLIDEESGAIHVYVLERDSHEQRFSRELRPRLLVEGIFLIDTSVPGTIYLGVTGSMPGAPPGTYSAQLLCLEPEHGEVLGVTDLSVNVGEEAILDAKALDAGGVVFSVFTQQGVRVERHDCP